MTTALQVTVPGPRNQVTLPDLMAAAKYRVLVSAVYGAGESTAVSATGRTGEEARAPAHGQARRRLHLGGHSADAWQLAVGPAAPSRARTAKLSRREAGLPCGVAPGVGSAHQLKGRPARLLQARSRLGETCSFCWSVLVSWTVSHVWGQKAFRDRSAPVSLSAPPMGL